MKMHKQPQRRGFTLVELLVVIVIIATLVALAGPKIMAMAKKGDQVTAMNNGRNMMLAMKDFANDYDTFPDKDTAKEVTARSGSPLNLNGDTANDYFRQLIAAKVIKSEDPFFAKTAQSKKKPDNNMEGGDALKPGEVGFGYIMNGTTAIGDDDPNRIIAVTPLLNNSAKGEFDASQFDNKAVFVYCDGSVKLQSIREDNKKVVISGNKTLLDSGEKTVWGTEIKPVIKPPKKK